MDYGDHNGVLLVVHILWNANLFVANNHFAIFIRVTVSYWKNGSVSKVNSSYI